MRNEICRAIPAIAPFGSVSGACRPARPARGFVPSCTRYAILVGTAVENHERQLRAELIVQEVLTTGVSEEDIRAAYDAQFANADPDAEYNAAHILVETEEEALALVDELAAGADFGNLARKIHGPLWSQRRGLGWFGQGMMVAPFEETVRLRGGRGVRSGSNAIRLACHQAERSPQRSHPPFEQVRSALHSNEQDAVTGKIAELESAAAFRLPLTGLILPF